MSAILQDGLPATARRLRAADTDEQGAQVTAMPSSAGAAAQPGGARQADLAAGDDADTDPAAMLPEVAPAAGQEAAAPQSRAVHPGGPRPAPSAPGKPAHGDGQAASAGPGPALRAAADAAAPAVVTAAAGAGAVPTAPPAPTVLGAAPAAAADAAAQTGVPAPVPVGQPAEQLGHAVAALHIGTDGGSQLTIRLDPAELGQVQVQIQRGHDGISSVSVAVERADTLGRLQADLAHLHQALDRAGVPEQRSLVLHLSPRQDAAGDASSGTAAFGGQSAGHQFGGNQSAGGQGSQGGHPQHTGRLAGSGIAGPALPAESAGAPAGARQHSIGIGRIAVGINITA